MHLPRKVLLTMSITMEGYLIEKTIPPRGFNKQYHHDRIRLSHRKGELR